jgi:hypothetical protein
MPSPKKKKEARYAKAGRKPNEPNTIKYVVLAILKALDKEGRLEKLNRVELINKIKEKFPESKFGHSHITWYLSYYNRNKPK